jgi:serine protease AprX
LQRRTPAAVLLAAALVAAMLSAAPAVKAAGPALPKARSSAALRAWAGSDAALVARAIARNPAKVPVEFDERLRWADSDGTLQVMVALARRDRLIEALIERATTQLAWYGSGPRFLARVTPRQLAVLLEADVVIFVEPDYPIELFMARESPEVRARSTDESGTYRFDATGGGLGRLVSNVPGLSAARVTGAGVRVAFTDSGIDRTHRDFGGFECTPGPYQPCDSRIVETVAVDHILGTGFEPSDALPTTELASGHGTHVAGIAAGNGYYTRKAGPNQSLYGGDGYVIGIAPNAEIVSVKNGDSQSAGLSTFALQWQLDNAARLNLKVSSNSWGCLDGCTINPNSVIAQVLRDLYRAGVVVVFAAGNSGGNADGAALSGYAAIPYVLGVGAYDASNQRLASFSSRGSAAAALPDPATWTPESEPPEGYRRPDVAAPGVRVWAPASLTGGTSTLLPRLTTADIDAGPGGVAGEYRSLSGTSMATPQVAGAAAVLFGACPEALPLEVMRAIMAGADPNKVRKTDGSNVAQAFEVGYGGLDLRAALDVLRSRGICARGDGPERPTSTPNDPSNTPSPGPSAPGGQTSPSPSPPTPEATPRQGDRTVTLEAERSKTVFGRTLTLTGKVSGDAVCTQGAEVVILRRVFGRDSFSEMARLNTGVDGSFVFDLSAERSAEYRARVAPSASCPMATSGPVDVLVRAKLVITHTTSCAKGARISGALQPRHPGSKVLLERRAHGTWKTVRSARINAQGRFKTFSQACGRHRVVWPQQDPSNLGARLAFRL